MLPLCKQRLILTGMLAVTAAGLLPAQSLPAIDPESLRAHISVLGADAMEGRGTGSEGIEKAARYLERALTAYGLRTVPGLRSYRQTFPLHGSTPLEETELKLFAPKDSYTLRLQEDYVLYSAGDQTFIPTSVPLIFVGYGIIAPEYDYNDYQSVDVTNAIVVFLSGEPASTDDEYFDGPRPTAHSSFVLKQKTAFARGARGSILIASPADRSMDDWYEQQRHFRFEEVRLIMTPSDNLNILLNAKLAPFLFSDARYSFDDITEFEKKGTMKSFPLALRAGFQGKFRERDFLASNIIGMIEGSDPVLKDSYVLLSAHYDHLGTGVAVDGDSIYNGVFDNASGVAALLEIARCMAASSVRPKRSVLFVFLTGEERGFLGSQYYCLNPVVPLHRTVANINIDGLSLFERTRSMIGVGAELSTLGELLQQSLQRSGVTLEEIPAELFRFDQFRNSDQFMFAQAGIPSLLITEGLQYDSTPRAEGVARYIAWTEEHYHMPSDDLSQPLNYEAGAQHAGVILRFAQELAGGAADPVWYEGVPFRAERLRTILEKR